MDEQFTACLHIHTCIYICISVNVAFLQSFDEVYLDEDDPTCQWFPVFVNLPFCPPGQQL